MHAGVAAWHGNHAEGCVNLIPQINASAVVEPTVHALKVHTEGHSSEILSCKGLASPEVAVGVVHFHGAGAHGVKAFKGWDQLASAKHLNVQATVRHFSDSLSQVGRAAWAVHIKGRALAVSAGHLPVEDGAVLSLRDSRRNQRAACHGSTGEKLATDKRHG